jgi:hypothetical protein
MIPKGSSGFEPWCLPELLEDAQLGNLRLATTGKRAGDRQFETHPDSTVHLVFRPFHGIGWVFGTISATGC